MKWRKRKEVEVERLKPILVGIGGRKPPGNKLGDRQAGGLPSGGRTKAVVQIGRNNGQLRPVNGKDWRPLKNQQIFLPTRAEIGTMELT